MRDDKIVLLGDNIWNVHFDIDKNVVQKELCSSNDAYVFTDRTTQEEKNNEHIAKQTQNEIGFKIVITILLI